MFQKKAVCFFLVSYLAYSVILQMEAVCFCKTWVDFYWTTWNYISENNILHRFMSCWGSSWNPHFKFKHQVEHYLKNCNPHQKSEHINPIVRVLHVKFFQIFLWRFEVTVSFWAFKIGPVVSVHTLHQCFEAIPEERNVWQPLKTHMHVLQPQVEAGEYEHWESNCRYHKHS